MLGVLQPSALLVCFALRSQLPHFLFDRGNPRSVDALFEFSLAFFD